MTDVVYVLGTGSNWADNELRFSLRSLETYIQDIGTVYVVGERPSWLTGVVHLPFGDKTACKERNIMLKLAYACGHPDLSEIFLHVHDDHFCLAPVSASEIPNWYAGSLSRMLTVRNKNHWHQAVSNTDKVLSEHGFSTNNFDIHFPMLFNKILYPQVMDLYNWSYEPRGYVVKSLYANTLGIQGTPTADLKLNQRHTFKELVDRLAGRPWFSVGNGGLTSVCKQLLQALYPTPSRFEI